jgi:hypothetical protein
MNTYENPNWLCPDGHIVPDFIIAGAMKCGTSTVHELLNRHEKVFIPDSEINFFDIDDLFQHSDFFSFNGAWHWPDFSTNPDSYWKWYQNFFKDAPADCLIGEDSTCYLPSAKAAKRIASQRKPIKIIICLRNPVDRAYSQYWHMLRTGRAMFSFEDTIRFTPEYVLQRSMYLEQVQRFTASFSRSQIFFFVLEDFLARKEQVISNLLYFLGLDKAQMPSNAIETHANSATLPRNIELCTWKNRILQSVGNTHYLGRLPFQTVNRKSIPWFVRGAERIHRKFNPLAPRNTPPMNDATKEFLMSFFQAELMGLSEIVGIDLENLWFTNERQLIANKT